MTLAFIMLALGGILLGGAWSFWRQKQPRWLPVVMVVLGLICVAVSRWRINQG